MEAIKVKDLTKKYGSSRGITDVNLSVNEGEIFGFIGPNGAGKSTTIKTLLNFIFPNSGHGEILGYDIVGQSSEIKKNVTYVPSDVRYYSESKVKDIIKYAQSFFNDVDKNYAEELCNELEIELDKRMGELSLGNKKKVAIVQALISKPKVIILDEPTNGLDPLVQQKLFKILLREKKKGTTIFLSSHNLVEVENFCDRVAIIKDGKIIDIITLSEVRKKLGKRITIESKEINKEKVKLISREILKEDEKEIVFIYDKDINELIEFLFKFKVDKLLIEEISLEDSFLDYYKSGEVK